MAKNYQNFFNKIKRRIINFLPPVSRFLLEKEIRKFFKKNDFYGDILEIGAGKLPIIKILPVSAYKSYKNLDLISGPSVDIVADIQQRTNLPDSSFDTIVAKEVLEHLPEPHLAVVEIYRLLKKGGMFIGSTRFIYPYHGVPYDYYRFTEYGLKQIFKNFDKVIIIPQGSWLINLWDCFTYSLLFFPLRLFNVLFVIFNYRRSIFPSGFIIIAYKN